MVGYVECDYLSFSHDCVKGTNQEERQGVQRQRAPDEAQAVEPHCGVLESLHGVVPPERFAAERIGVLAKSFMEERLLCRGQERNCVRVVVDQRVRQEGNNNSE